MNFWEELDACKFNDNEYLVDHLIEVIKDENINSLEELIEYENKYFLESNMTREEWVKWYEDLFEDMPELNNLNDDSLMTIDILKSEIKSTNDINIKIKNIITICVMVEREFCFLVEAYNLIMGGSVNNIELSEKEKIVDNVNYNSGKNVVLCGSMKVKDEILKAADELKNMGYNPILPLECLRGESKVIASKAHMDRIVNPSNEYILVVNAIKDGIENYIGPNTLVEIAFGFYHNKKVILLNGIYESYKEELIGWEVNCLSGDLSNINRL